MTAPLVLRAGRVIDPGNQIDATVDVVLRDGRVAGLEKPGAIEAGARVLDVRGLWVLPGLVDLRCVLDDELDLLKAKQGGFTTLLADPSSTWRGTTELRVKRVGALVRGTELAEVSMEAPVALSAGSAPLASSGLLRRALQYARSLSLPVMLHSEDASLSGRGLLGEGPTATRLGLQGVPASAEVSAVARDLALFEDVGGRLHFSHLTCAGSLRYLKEARTAGLFVSADVTAHHLRFTDELADGYSLDARVWPVLRSKADAEALRAAAEVGLIDAVATDHRCPSAAEREPPFDHCVPGRDAFATALSDVLAAGLSALRAVALLTSGPAQVLGLEAGRLAVGGPADVAVFDPKSGRMRYTFVAGQLVHEDKAR